MDDKIFLVLTSKRSKADNEWKLREQYVRTFYEAVQDISGIRTLYATYDSIVCTVENNQTKIITTDHNIDLDKVSVVHFKNWMFNQELASTIAFYLRTHGVTFFNSEVDAGLAWGKTSQMFRLAEAGVPVPDSLYASREKLLEYIESDSLPERFQYPLIIKSDQGVKGDDNFLVHDKADAIASIHKTEQGTEFIVQCFLPNDGDYRVLFMGTSQDPLIFKRTAVAGSHLNNTSKGGSGEFIDVKDFPPQFLEIAKKSVDTLKREIGGVDVLVDSRTDKPYVLEVNSTPALATGYGVDVKQVKFSDFLRSTISTHEEHTDA